jgi:asparagine synthase (glutamine-hydrolysing)
MLADLEVLGGEASASWFDGAKDIAVGRAYRKEHGSAAEPPVVHHGDCAIVLDGRLSSGRTAPGELSSDSLIVIESYLRWGDDCSAHLDGEFAFALWDRRNSRLLCACDVLGRRTLAFHWDGSRLLACTRAVTLLRHPRVPRTVDAVYLVHALCDLWAQPAGMTPFSTIRRLRPGFSVAVEGSKIIERQVDRLRLERPAKRGNERAVYDEFWALLDASTRERLRGVSKPCILLSGGLDSACVASSVSRGVGAADAFSFLRDTGASVDERRAIEAVVRQYPSLRWRTIQVSNSPAFAEASPDAPVCDDPSINAAPFLPSRFRAWRTMAEAGHDAFVDGEGGDEIFDMAMRPGDLFAARAWGAAASYLVWHRSRSSTVLRGLVVPHLGGALLRAWLARERRRRDPVPPWIRPVFRRRPETEHALGQQSEWLARRTFAEYLPALLETAPVVGTTGAMRLLASSVGLRGSSPLFDRSIVEFAARVPVQHRLHHAHSKAFLRNAADGRLPDEVRWRPKHNKLYDELVSEELAGHRAAALLGATKDIAALAAHVDSAQLVCLLARLSRGGAVATPMQRKVRSFLALAGWWQHVESIYGSLTGAA